jgi:hypothetical protein
MGYGIHKFILEITWALGRADRMPSSLWSMVRCDAFAVELEYVDIVNWL